MQKLKIDTFINQLSKYIELNQEEIELIRSKVIFRKYIKGHFVVQEGDICKHRSFVISGCLKTFHLDDNGHEHIIAFAIENWWAGDLGSFLTQTPAFFNVQCIEDTELIQLSKEDLEGLYETIPKLNKFFRSTIENAYVESRKRIINSFSLSAKTKYLQFKKQYPRIHQRIPKYMIAAYLGVTPEFLSRIRNQIIQDQ